MKIALVALDVLVILFAFAAAVELGSRFSPNILVFLLVFLGLRLLLQWLFFKTFILRPFPLFRSSVQFVILLICIPIILFVASILPFLNTLLDQVFVAYYLFIPASVLVMSSLLQHYFVLEG